MPSLSLSLPDIEQSVARPVIFQILKQLFEITRLSPDTRIVYAGKRSVIQTPGTSIDEEGQRDAQFGTGRYTFVDVTENYDTPAIQEIQSHAFDNVPLFEDIGVLASLRPIYLPSEVTVSIIYRSNSETEVERWMTEMVSRVSRGRDLNLHRIEYLYPIPFDFIELIEDIWTLKEAQAGSGISFQNYFRSHASERLTLIANRAGEMRQLALQEVQTRIQGLFDFAGIPEKPKRDDKTGTWEISFSYKFSYQRPDAIYVNYPIAVHNQLLPRRWLSFLNQAFDPNGQAHYYSKSYEALGMFEADNAVSSRPSYPYLRLPHFDDFKPASVLAGTGTIFTALTFITPQDTQTLMNVNDLDDYRIDGDILDFLLQSEAPYVNRLYQSIFQLHLYRNGTTTAMEKCELLADGTIRSTVPLDLSKTYHVRLSLVLDIHLLSQDAINRLLKWPKAFVKLLSALNEMLRLNPDFTELGNRRHIDAWEFGPAWWILTGTTPGNLPGSGRIDLSYPGDNLENWPGWTRETFLKDVDPAELQRYLKLKRRLTTVQIMGVVVHRLTE